MKMKIINILSFILLGTTCFNAQADRHYSMFYGNAVSYNPAAAGMFNGDGRAFSSYRNQWSSVTMNPYKTINFSMDGKVMQKQIENGMFGLGFTYYRDKAGDGNMINSNFGLALSYAVEVQKDFFLSAGVQAGLGQYKINFDNFTWGNQWVGNGYDPSVYNFEPFYDEVNSLFDLSAGVYVHGVVNEYIDVEGGIAVSHILKQDVSFISASDNLYRNVSLSFFPEYRIPYKRIAIDPGIYGFIQGPNKELTLGTDIKYFIKESSHYTGYYDETSMSLGSYLRLGDGIIFTGAFNFSGISLGLSYDVNTSNLRVASGGLGAYEFFLRYRLGFGYKYSNGGRGRF
jgi:type IX secretion system PorP/SprF family membrane protein